jgi:xanthine dehydrogenase accessory factor
MIMTKRQYAFQKDISDLAHEMKARGDAFAMATVVRTVSVTAAKPGAKAIIDEHGNVLDGWIGGGCARHAVLKAALASMDDGKARLVSIQPEELLADQRAELAIDNDKQVVNTTNLCPSKGSMDIFVEPILANPLLLVIGDSPVARTLADIGALFDLNVVLYSFENTASHSAPSSADQSKPPALGLTHPHRYIVVSTQGSSDLKALELALSLESRHIGFVGSQRKIQHLQNKLRQAGQNVERLQQIKSPAGLDIKAVTPQEIALSILAEIVMFRRS